MSAYPETVRNRSIRPSNHLSERTSPLSWAAGVLRVVVVADVAVETTKVTPRDIVTPLPVRKRLTAGFERIYRRLVGLSVLSVTKRQRQTSENTNIKSRVTGQMTGSERRRRSHG